jgi:Na+-transporting NADH:ubiquinone oxidoreductase subunit C
VDKAKRESIGNVLFVALVVCLVCSIVVSTAAVALKPRQDFNAELDRKMNVLVAAGMLQDGQRADEQGRGIEELFAQFDVRVVDLRTGEFTDAVDPNDYDQLRAARDPQRSVRLSRAEDQAGIGRREHYALVYVLEDEQGSLERIVLPIRGQGLWAAMFGFLALESDLKTAAGLAYYQHSETPGLGGEVDNPRWKNQWDGVRLMDADLNPAIRLVKTRSSEGSEAARYEVDALSGATLTTRGVEDMVRFWTGDKGFGPLLERLQQAEAS